jgi:hypothetical protein
MTGTSPNPYESPQVGAFEKAESSQPGYWGWRLIPAAVFAVLGCFSGILGLLLSAILLIEFLHSPVPAELYWGNIALCCCMIFVGVAWIVAAFAFEHRRYTTAIVATFAGFVPPAIWFLTIRW